MLKIRSLLHIFYIELLNLYFLKLCFSKLFQKPGDIHELQSEKIDRMFHMGLPVQPYIISIGQSLEEVTDFYVVMDELKYKFESPLRALDTCFKLFFTWDVNFAPESQQAWLFLGIHCIILGQKKT